MIKEKKTTDKRRMQMQKEQVHFLHYCCGPQLNNKQEGRGRVQHKPAHHDVLVTPLTGKMQRRQAQIVCGVHHRTVLYQQVDQAALAVICRHVEGCQQQHESTNKGVNQCPKAITQTQQRPESPTVALTWHTCKYKGHKLHQRYILT